MSGPTRFSAALFALITMFLAGCGAEPENTSTDTTPPLAAAPIAADCDFLSGAFTPPLDAQTCTADPSVCAKKLNACLLNLDFLKQPNMWVLQMPYGAVEVASTKASNARALASVQGMTPMHGRYNTVFLNATAATAFNQQILRDPLGHIDTASLPHGSVIIKQNFASAEAPAPGSEPANLEGEPWLTVMAKIKGYCQPTVGGGCVGGEWFYYLYRFDGFKQFNNVPVYGKPQAFCTDCHNPAAKSDFVWNLQRYVRGRQKPYFDDGAKTTYLAEKALPSSALCADAALGIGPNPPADLPFAPESVPEAQRQTMFDCFSWRSFLALNWPAAKDERGVPNTKGALRDLDAPRVWETYKETAEVFQPQDADWNIDKQAWNDSQFVPQVCKQYLDKLPEAARAKVLQMITKTRSHQLLNETHQAMGNQFNILVDQAGKLVQYEVRFNRDEFEYLKAKGFANTGAYSYAGPKQGEVFFPTNADGHSGLGSIEVKAAWRELCAPNNEGLCLPAEETQASRYYVQSGLIYTAAASLSPGSPESCRVAKMGLVGLHVIRKTEHAPQWVWSTFEHVDNVPPQGQPAEQGKDYLLYDAACEKYQPTAEFCSLMRPGINPRVDHPNKNCCANAQLIVNANPAIPSPDGVLQPIDAKPLIKNHVTRLVPIGAEDLNNRIRKTLPQPWANYFLVNTQWPSGARQSAEDAQPSAARRIPCKVADLLWAESNGTPSAFLAAGIAKPNCYTMQPQVDGSELKLRNTTMETFQAAWNHPGTPQATQVSSQSCFNCHGFSGVDFSFVFTDASEEIVPIGSAPAADEK